MKKHRMQNYAGHRAPQRAFTPVARQSTAKAFLTESTRERTPQGPPSHMGGRGEVPPVMQTQGPHSNIAWQSRPLLSLIIASNCLGGLPSSHRAGARLHGETGMTTPYGNDLFFSPSASPCLLHEARVMPKQNLCHFKILYFDTPRT